MNDDQSMGSLPEDQASTAPDDTEEPPPKRQRTRRHRVINNKNDHNMRQEALAKLVGQPRSIFNLIFRLNMDHTFSHTWINDYDLPETYFEDLTFDHVSMKWDVLTRYGVLSVGDVLEITFDTPDANGQKVFMDAEIVATPKFSVYPPIRLDPTHSGPIVDGVLRGPKAILGAVKANFGHLGQIAEEKQAWKAIRVFRGGRSLGTAYEIRAAWSRWCELYHIYIGDNKYPTVNMKETKSRANE